MRPVGDFLENLSKKLSHNFFVEVSVTANRFRSLSLKIHPKIGCLNFKPKYLLNYSCPTNDLYSVRKRRIRAFKSIFKLLGWGPLAMAPDFAPNLCTRRVSDCFSACFTCWGRFDPMLIPSGIKGDHKRILEKRKSCAQFCFDFLVPFSWFRRHHVNIPWKGAECYAISSENLIQEFSLP